MIKFDWVEVGDILNMSLWKDDGYLYSSVVKIESNRIYLSRISYMSRTEEVLEYNNGKWLLSFVSMGESLNSSEIYDIRLYKCVDFRDKVLDELVLS